MLRKSLALRLFEAFNIQRWNDKIRTVELTEMDKNAHKMIITFCLGKYEEMSGNVVNWDNIIKGGMFELLRRIALSDIKSPIYRKIKYNHKDVFSQLNGWVYAQIEPSFDDNSMKLEFKKYLEDDEFLDPLSKKILEGAHIYASDWEFQIVRQANPDGYQIKEIDRQMKNDLEPYLDLLGMRKLISLGRISGFIELCGQLRFQMRWGHLPRIPKTSVLGHMLLVACFSYFFSCEVKACPKRLYNNFFGGLFHDLPEAVTRDIINPVKTSVDGLPEVISSIEQELAEKEIFPLLEDKWIEEMKYFTRDEFSGKVTIDSNTQIVSSTTINNDYNEDRFSPIDGEIIKVADHLAAFLEAYVTTNLGLNVKEMVGAMHDIKSSYEKKNVAGIAIKSLYADF